MTYEDWFEVGKSNGYLIQYIKQRDVQLDKVKKQLEQAFTPKVKSLLNKKIRDETEDG
tara:strand:- start:370 stop:543 length:174 start_codon:yes stop_codon:yes gene_type:complete